MNPSQYLSENMNDSVEQLKALLRIPSISAQSKHQGDMAVCAKWIHDFFKNLNFRSKIMETAGHPVVYAEYFKSSQVPTVLIYGHYDVQPVDPIDLWDSPPFEPIEKNGYLVARGAVDDKGQMFAHFKGVEAHLKTNQTLPLNVKFLIEGEEENSTSHLDEFIYNNSELLAADIALISDTAQYGPDMPAISYGLRGIAIVEVKITGPDKDLHSGVYGGAVANPIHILCQLIGRLHDQHGHITIDGFYNEVLPISDWEKEQLQKLPFNEAGFISTTGSAKLYGEEGFSVIEQTWCRPTLDCNGITGGYQGEGAKTIIPSWASAKITMRLVPNQNPTDISAKLENYLKTICPDTVTLEVHKFEGAKPVLVPTESPWLSASAKAIQKGFGRKPFFIKQGGSIPVVETLKNALKIDSLLVGFGQDDDNAHSPNERFLINDFHRGCLTSAALLEELARVKI